MYFAGSFFKKYIWVVGKGLFEFFALESNLPLVRTRQKINLNPGWFQFGLRCHVNTAWVVFAALRWVVDIAIHGGDMLG